MRDPSRIEPILAALCKAWHNSPDQRLGQFIYNLCREDNDLFFTEDDEMLKRLNHFATTMRYPWESDR